MSLRRLGSSPLRPPPPPPHPTPLPTQVWVEMVPGLGETLVGAWPGRALAAAVDKEALAAAVEAASTRGAEVPLPSAAALAGAVRVASLPSKPVWLSMGGAPGGATGALMARSDSNAEDLPG